MKKFKFLAAALGGFFAALVLVFVAARWQPESIGRFLFDSFPREAERADPDASRETPPFFARGGANGADDNSFADPIAEAARLQRKLLQDEMAEAFGDAEPGGVEIAQKEDEKSISIEISGADATKLHASVTNGYLSVQGESRQTRGNATFSSSFTRTLPLPPNVDETKMETLSEKDKVILRFPKKGR